MDKKRLPLTATFSVLPKDEAFIKNLKRDCKEKGKNFSFIVIKALKEHHGKS